MSSYRETLRSEGVDSEPCSEWNNMCRTCLQSGVSHSIFELDESLQLSYADKVMQCVNVTIRVQDDLPNRICGQCIEDLNVAYRFQLNCLEANALLQGSDTFDNLEEKQPNLSPIVMPLESGPEDEDQIAIHLDTGVMYTYKPPVGLNVKLTHSFLGESEEHRDSNEGDTIAEEADEANTGEDDVKFDTKTKMMIDPLPNSTSATQASRNDEVEYLIYLKDDSDELPATAGNIESMELSLGKRTQPTVNHTAVVEKRNHSMVQESVKTLQTIRKTNRPDEMKPTIEMVTSQPTTDGTGVETVIRIKRNLAGPKPSFLCKICNVTYKHKHALDTHLRRHRGDRPHKCEYCEKSFVVAFELQRHVRIHTGQKPYKCQYCDRAYADFGSKTKHERTHTGERPYVCDFCGKSFSYSHVLNSHRVIHTGMKKYCCSICGKRFSKSHHLKSHCNTHTAQTLIATVEAKSDASGLQTENNNTKQDTTNVVYSEQLQDELIASNDDRVVVHESSTMLGQQQTDSVVLVDSYPDTGPGLLTAEWPMVMEKGTTTSGITIVPEELESVSIVNFSDYMMKTEVLEGFMVEDSGDEEPLVERQLMGR